MRAESTPNQSWSPRWAKLKPHDVQLKLWFDQKRFKLVPAGRRSGKTELAKRCLVEHLFTKTLHNQPPRYFAAAPTRDQAKRIFWDDLKALAPADCIRSIVETQLRIIAHRNSELWVVGLDRPERIEGSPWDGCVIDELANCCPKIWDAHIRPALADRKGWAWLIGVPDMDSPAQAEYEQLVHLAQSGADPEWACYSWPSADILPPDEIESARRRLDPRLFEQEYLGKFVIARGKAFPDFDAAEHVRPAPYDPALPICWSLDFNINPMCSGVIQHHAGKITVLDELCLPDTSTDEACHAFLRLAHNKNWSLPGLKIYGDATGNARDSTSGQSDWRIVQNILARFAPMMRVPKSNPSIKDTVNAVRARIKSHDGLSRLIISPTCLNLINDLRTALWPDKDDLTNQHALSWLRYFIAAEYPITLNRPVEPGLIGFSAE
jgi:hypothetical protein